MLHLLAQALLRAARRAASVNYLFLGLSLIYAC
jgi:hypothetical protein